MTLKGAIAELQLLLKANDMPIYYKPCIEKVIETIQMEWTYQMSRLDEMERRIELHEKAMEKAMRDTADTPQTESTGSPIGDYRDGVGVWKTDCEDRYAIRTDSGEVVAYACPLGCEQTDCPWE